MSPASSLAEGPRVTAFVGLGANLGNPARTLEAAMAKLALLPSTSLVRRSALYRTAPINTEGPFFMNAVAQLDTGLAPEVLLERLFAMEVEHGRQRPFRNAPRTLDLDLLLYGGLMLETPLLVLPHPRMHQRAFVLHPLLEIAPDIVIPGLGTASALLPSVAGQGIESVVADEPTVIGLSQNLHPRPTRD